jgi:diacylglycerol kinase
VVLRTQHNAWIHAVATVLVVGTGLVLRLSRLDWCWLVVAIALVWSAEAMNTALERLADATSPDPHPLVRDAKDAAAGAVLVLAVAAVAIGVFVLGPHLLARLG